MQFKRIAPALALAGIAVVATGCAGFRVYDSPDGGWLGGHSISGIPFIAKIPVVMQTTQWSVRAVSVVVTQTIGEGKDKKVEALPPSPILVPASLDLMNLISALKLYMDGNKNASEAEIIKRLNAISTASVDEWKAIYAGTQTAEAALTSNTVSVETILAPDRYYITPVTPLFGSNDASFDFGPDGTLSKASTKIQDDTAKTILSFLPIPPLAAKAKGTTKMAVVGYDGAGQTSVPAAFTFSATDASAVYTMKQCKTCTDAKHGLATLVQPGEPLKLAQVGKGEVQLVSVVRGATADKGKEKKKPGYEISGTITLPDTSGSDADTKKK